MKGEKLIKILKTFSKTEIKEFKKFLSSPYHNEGRNYVSFYSEIIKYYPDFNEIKFSMETVSKNINNPETLHFAMSHLTKLAYHFLYLEQKKNDKLNEYIDLSNILRKRGFDKYALSLCEEAEKELLKKKSDRDYYYNSFKLNIQKSIIYIRENDVLNQFSSITKMSEYFFIYFLGEIVRFLEIMQSYKGNYNFDYDSTYFANIIDSLGFGSISKNIDKLKIDKTSFVKIYSLFIERMNKEKGEEYFSVISEILEKGYDELEPFEAAFVISKLQNDWLWLNQRTINGSLSSSFEATKKYFLNIFNNDKFSYFKMNPNTFRNIFITAIELNELEWAEDFIQKYGNKLYPEVKEDMIKWAYGVLYFRKKEFEKSLNYMNQVKDVVDILKFDIRRDILKLNYELKYYDRIPELINSFRHFLSNTKTSIPHVIDKEKIFLLFFSKLYNCAVSKDIGKIKLLQKQINEIDLDSWILDKLKELNHV